MCIKIETAGSGRTHSVYFTHFKFQFHSRIYGHKNGGMAILWPLPLTKKHQGTKSKPLSDF